MNRRSFLRALGASALLPFISKAAAPAPWLPTGSGKRPNIVFILCDDLGWGDLGAFWQNQRTAENRIHTPNLDRAIAEGVKLTRHLSVSPVCAPARASLMTGKNQGHCSVRDNTFDCAIDPHMTLATVLKSAGYATWHIGKWGIGGGYQSQRPRTAMPCQAGFDFSYSYPAHLHGHSYYHCCLDPADADKASSHSPILESYSEAAYAQAGRPEGFSRDCQPGATCAQWRRPASEEESRFVYDTDLFTAKAKELIRTHQERTPSAPFFLYLCYTTVHGSGNPAVFDPAIRTKTPFHVPGSPYPALSEDPTWGGGATLTGSVKATPQTANTWIHPDYRAYATPSQRRYATTVRRLDDALGDLLHFLRLRGLEDNTLFVFTSDNGPAGEYLSPAGLQWVHTLESAGPFRGMKRWSYEGGLREPTFVRWRGTLPEGKTCDFPANVTCWMPTLADAAGLPPPAHSDGVSLLPILSGSGRQLPCRLYTEYVDGGSGKNFGFEQTVCSSDAEGDWLLIRNSGHNQNAPELYNLRDDPAQERDLASTFPERVKRMLPLLVTCRIPASHTPEACGAPTFAETPHPAKRKLDHTPLPGLLPEVPTPPDAAWLYRGEWQWVPDFRALMPVHAFPPERMKSICEKLPKQGVGILRHGCLTLETPTRVTFQVEGEGGCHVWIHEAHILEYEAGDCKTPRSITVNLDSGRHPWRVALTAPFVSLTATDPSGTPLPLL